MTAFRTSAASAIATRYLARADAKVLGLVGLGVEGRAHFDAIRVVRDIERVVGWTRTQATADRFREHVGDAVPFELLESPEAVVKSCDVLCTLTASATPVVLGEWLSPGMHINAVGAHENTAREIDTEVVLRSKVVVDILASVLDECGDLNIPLGEGAITADHFSTELGELVNGTAHPRQSDRDITLYKAVGVAVQDIATAHLVYTRARERGLGVDVGMG